MLSLSKHQARLLTLTVAGLLCATLVSWWLSPVKKTDLPAQLSCGGVSCYPIPPCRNVPYCGGNNTCEYHMETSGPCTTSTGQAGTCNLSGNCVASGGGSCGAPTACCTPGGQPNASNTCCTSTGTFKPAGSACTIAGSNGTCDAMATCLPASGGTCGNGMQDPGEGCDDGNPNGGTCGNDCQPIATYQCCSGGWCSSPVPANTCPGQGCTPGQTCRASAGACDVAEVCTANGACPTDSFAAAGSVCRAAANSCDVQETCTGSSTACPSDSNQPNGTSCNDNNACTQTDACQSGSCTGSNAITCTPNQCQTGGTCNAATGSCSFNNAANGTPCNDGNANTSSDTCTNGTCAGVITNNASSSSSAAQSSAPASSSSPASSSQQTSSSSSFSAIFCTKPGYLCRGANNGACAGVVFSTVCPDGSSPDWDTSGIHFSNGCRMTPNCGGRCGYCVPTSASSASSAACASPGGYSAGDAQTYTNDHVNDTCTSDFDCGFTACNSPLSQTLGGSSALECTFKLACVGGRCQPTNNSPTCRACKVCTSSSSKASSVSSSSMSSSSLSSSSSSAASSSSLGSSAPSSSRSSAASSGSSRSSSTSSSSRSSSSSRASSSSSVSAASSSGGSSSSAASSSSQSSVQSSSSAHSSSSSDNPACNGNPCGDGGAIFCQIQGFTQCANIGQLPCIACFGRQSSSSSTTGGGTGGTTGTTGGLGGTSGGTTGGTSGGTTGGVTGGTGGNSGGTNGGTTGGTTGGTGGDSGGTGGDGGNDGGTGGSTIASDVCAPNTCEEGGLSYCKAQGYSLCFGTTELPCIRCEAPDVASAPPILSGEELCAVYPFLCSSSSATFTPLPGQVMTTGACGNGTLNLNEECDDTNTLSGDGCSASCELERGICGDGVVQTLFNEQCEAGVVSAFPCDSSTCRYRLATCGNNTVDAGESCDEGSNNSNLPGRCRPDCSAPRCGDRIQDAGESCDDGNRVEGDGCSASCVVERQAALPMQTLPASVFDLPFTQQQQSAVISGQLPVYSLPAQTYVEAKGKGPTTTDSGPETILLMAMGAATGVAWMRRRRM